MKTNQTKIKIITKLSKTISFLQREISYCIVRLISLQSILLLDSTSLKVLQKCDTCIINFFFIRIQFNFNGDRLGIKIFAVFFQHIFYLISL